MADLSFVHTNVRPGAGAVQQQGTAGATITAGKVVFQDTDNLWKLSDANAAAAAKAHGIASTSASPGQPVSVQTGGSIVLGATLASGAFYVASPNSGNICPITDLTSGCYTLVLGYAASTTELVLAVVDGAVPLP